MAKEDLLLIPQSWIEIGRMVDDYHHGRLDLLDNTPEKSQDRLDILTRYNVAFKKDSKGQKIVKDVQFHLSDPSVIHIMIPPKQAYLNAKRKADLGAYMVHDHYIKFVTNHHDALEPPEMFLFEVGQYTLGHCGGG